MSFKDVLMESPRVINFRKAFGFEPPLDTFMSVVSHSPMIDLEKLEKKLEAKDPDFNSEESTYKGNFINLTDYVIMKYGEEANKAIDKLI